MLISVYLNVWVTELEILQEEVIYVSVQIKLNRTQRQILVQLVIIFVINVL